jgi:hypothetical protein
MAPDNVHAWEKVQEIGPSGRFSFVGDAAVRFVGPTLTQIVRDVASNARHGSISDVVLGPADASGWKVLRPDRHSWAWLVRRPRSSGSDAILIGLLLPAAPVLGPVEQQALTLLRPCLAPGARLLLAGHKFTLKPPVPASFNGYDAGFTGGVFVATT